MLIGVPKEIKNHEYRVGLTPSSVKELVKHGHQVMIEHNAGVAIDFTNEEYVAAGAEIVSSAEEIFARGEMIVKVKEPQSQESEVAGRMSVKAGAHHLEKAQGGRGVLLAGVPGVAPANVLVIGGGVVGDNAASMAVGMGANVTILDRSIPRLRQLDSEYEGRASCVFSTDAAIEEYALQADLVIGAVLVHGAAAPKLLSNSLIKRMKKGAVVVDVAIDQGGCFETSKATTHDHPTYIVDGVVHYCVANMPGGVARTATMALNNATLPYAIALANDPVNALFTNSNLQNGLNVHKGSVTYKAVADALGYTYVPADEALKA